MPYRMNPKLMYMMPTHFGPMAGPRQGPGGQISAFATDQRLSQSYTVRFLTRREQLDALLPEGFSVTGDPIVTVTQTHMTGIDWLAGRGYSTLGVTFPAQFDGTHDRARGPFLSVLWENLTDPILTGREQLGFSKIYCELPEPVTHAGRTCCTASWLGFRFMDMALTNMVESEGTDGSASANGQDDPYLQGTLHYKYIPHTGNWGEADVAYAVLSPTNPPVASPTGRWQGEGTVTFHQARWEDLPTQHMIVNALADLEITEYCGATIEHRVGGRDLSDQHMLG